MLYSYYNRVRDTSPVYHAPCRRIGVQSPHLICTLQQLNVVGNIPWAVVAKTTKKHQNITKRHYQYSTKRAPKHPFHFWYQTLVVTCMIHHTTSERFRLDRSEIFPSVIFPEPQFCIFIPGTLGCENHTSRQARRTRRPCPCRYPRV